jgi:hypothetical protein
MDWQFRKKIEIWIEMGKAAKSKFYAIRRGFKTGIFTTPWEETKKLVDGFKGAVYQGFKEAEAFMKNTWNDRVAKSTAKNDTGQSSSALAKKTTQSSALMVTSSQSRALVAVGQEPLIVYTDGSCLGNGRSDAKGTLKIK